ncbi:MAG TPA: 50S ribosomal protein L10 [Candidatus Saccharimonadales bacterium]|nr:50S ribosomal protein L10 [Candidatus Saccharimonadales bacterium]
MAKQKQISAREIKQGTVQALTEKIQRTKTLAFADYRGLTVNQISEIRNKVKDAGGEVLVTKNTLMKRALRTNNYPAFKDEQLAGPTATIFAYEDELAPIKVIADTAKTTGIPSFKFGFFNKDFLDIKSLDMLAKIPGRAVLQAQVVGAVASPLYGFVSVLQGNIRNLVSIIDQLSKK